MTPAQEVGQRIGQEIGDAVVMAVVVGLWELYGLVGVLAYYTLRAIGRAVTRGVGG